MSSKNLSGYLLAVSPILMIVMFAAVFPAVIGTGEDGLKGQELAKASIEAGMEHVHLTYVVATIGGLAMMGMFLGYTLWARLLQGDDKKGNALVVVAAIAMPVAAAGMMMSMDFNFAAARAWIKGDEVNALTIQAVAEYAGNNFIWTFIFLSVGFTGLASALQTTDKISKTVGYILAIISVIMLIINVGGIDGGGAAFIIFLAVMIATVASGVNLIRQKA